jgi:hypothetical protein
MIIDDKPQAAVIPWGKLLRSVPVWASAVATMGNQWGDATLALGMTKYLKLIYGFSTANVSNLSLTETRCF